MECRIGDVTVHYAEHGSGVPLVALHGAGVDHREIEAAVEAVVPGDGLRRIYPDLPGMGKTSADGLGGNDDVVALLGAFLDEVVGEPALVLGHSYGAYVARGVVARRPERALGLALLCPVGGGTGAVPEPSVVREEDGAGDELEPGQQAGFEEYFVVRTRATARRYREAVVPGTELVDEEALGRIFGNWTIDLGSSVFPGPTLIAAGRRDASAGYEGASALLETYPGATLAVIDDAGHALMHERPELLAALLADWLERAATAAGRRSR